MKIIQNRGISLMEILIIISIIGIISAIVIPNSSDFRKKQALKNTTEDVVSLLNEARNSTLSSKNLNNYGVHFDVDKAILFSGTSFVDASSNKQIDFDSSVNIPEDGGINLEGGGNDIVFHRMTGETSEYGTIIIQQINNPSHQNVISINSVGLIEVN
jgi:Tfp pilus assembly protein FimT